MKGFVVTDNSEGALRFLTTNAFDALAAAHELRLIVARSPLRVPHLEELVARQPFPATWLPFYRGRFQRWNDLFDISCVANQELSPSFRDRFERSRKGDPVAARRRTVLAPIYPQYRRLVERFMGVHPDLLAAVQEHRPDFIVVASSLLDYHTDEVMYLAHRLGIPTLMLVAGWDNLSSKGLLFHLPTRMGVWGEQTRRHAIAIQGSAPESIVVVGAPHYDQLRAEPTPPVDRITVRRSWGVPVDRPLILFAGSFRQIDETSQLERLDRAIESGELPQIHVLYRPHPLRERREHERDFFSLAWRNVTIDPEMAEGLRLRQASGQLPDNFIDRIGHLQRLYRVIDGIICPMSTVLLEALLCGVPGVAAAFGDGKHLYGVDKSSRMLHFKELYEVPGLVVCREQEQLVDAARTLCAKLGNATLRAELVRDTRLLVHDEARPYGERVAATVDEMLAGHSVSRPRRVRPGRRYKLEEIVKDRAVYQIASSAIDRVVRKVVT